MPQPIPPQYAKELGRINPYHQVHPIIALFFISSVVLGVGNYVWYQAIQKPLDEYRGGMCTLEAKVCPDGSQVGRTGPSCQFAKCPSESVVKALIKACPEKWYNNAMPGPIGSDDVPRQYYVYQNQRRELAEFDRGWISQNCSLQMETVY
ncbi:MAG: hypothetical protein A3C85_00465 [Candidatus Doudnabacteria bacterium RIFCSPHIGHO2_02_FULL_48_21]|uniref:Uncharacterized protein n=1 Tax=Candidatus Doudnabacteria bacterium RIFCSPLOWO2_02_FULL_48_13 TaxID=1817845 RepID=A0A1F5QCR9_9BACT|nr:MAG: hypothetical protein A3K05_01075 [Candidatus Doudnabacteria bacterium RIFCSPHIGHO2_01_48_18]OGE79188.1 MAG: hypothetical protein A2668_00415 [Candidatus Doudnabacteria bacterium RIFCSPHIGHO2_01_FULL_48_180]OGE91820.1 MAG: hypothetical protein A3F44_00975 [Candidatus Doudnabacteria bacterium RIFCSPHIGHO2_12_FULL_47_25]OGE93670.1 MAG: hypothetical protein A3C85_00465 [Candidatus Doudnabacteria bacterium RIFCSPHIGHO2_02_FULL_48_21]OGE97951.1 MAG: hypothetical protein A3A83_00650 [Candidatu